MPKANKKRGKGSSTSGKIKGKNCQRSQLKNLYSKDARIYKRDPATYEKACMEIASMKGNQPYKPPTE